MNYWQEYIKDVEPCLLRHPDTAKPDKQEAGLSKVIPLSILPAESARDVEPLLVLVSAWGLILSLYTGNFDVCFGIQDRLSGHASTRLFRMRTDPSISLDTSLDLIKADLTNGALSSLNSIQGILTAAGSVKTERLCNTAVVTCEYDLGESFLDADKYDVVVFLKVPSTIILRYRSSFMSQDAASDMGGALQEAFLNIRNPSKQYIGDIGVIGEKERTKLEHWNKKLPADTQRIVHREFETQARKTPNAPAVSAWDGSWTYAELEALSSSFARHLTSLNIGPEVPVLLCFEKSKWHVLSSFAVLKAGGVCASIDPMHPVNRLRSIAQNSEASILLCSESLVHKLQGVVPTIIPVSQSNLDTLTKGISKESFSLDATTANNAAFIVFTSGSTGKPKGIVQQHGAFCWASEQFQRLIGTTPGRRVLQFAAYTFDISIVDTFITLMYGACLCIPSTDERVNDLAGFINRSGVNQACITSTVARTLRPQEVPDLEVLCLAGEAATKDNFTTWADQVSLLNAYGPAEVSVAVLCKTDIALTTEPADTGSSIGGKCWVVCKNNHRQLAPIGAIGELLAEGPHLARGYLNDEEKTNAAFIPKPEWFGYSHGYNTRLYRTGDLVRYNTDGSLFFVGRADSQVKVRGQRVELSEVEHHIFASGLVDNVAVMFPTKGPFEKSLVGILAFKDLAPASINVHETLQLLDSSTHAEQHRRITTLKTKLDECLPSYMVPANWLTLCSFPLSPSGKLDRKALQDWVQGLEERPSDDEQNGSEASGKDSKHPMTEAQRDLASACSYVLNVAIEKIRMTDSFLRIGGDSVSAMAVVARCRQDGKIKISVQDLLQTESLQDAADRARTITTLTHTLDLSEKRDVLFNLTGIQEMFISRTVSTDYSQSFLLKTRHGLGKDEIMAALQTVVRQHSMLRARFWYDQDSHSWHQKIEPYSPAVYNVNFHKFDLMEHVYDKNSSTRKTLDLCKGPVFAVNIFLDNQDLTQIIFLTAHHMIIDLVSWRIILHDLEEILGQTNKRPQRDTTSLSFQAWARLQQEFVPGMMIADSQFDLEAEPSNLEYWAMAAVPSTFGNAVTESFELSSTTTTALLGTCNTPLATEPFDLFLGVAIHAFAITFPDRAVPAFFTESHGREATDWQQANIDPSETVGWFTTMYPIVLPSKKRPDLTETIAEAKDARHRYGDSGFAWFSSRFLGNDAEKKRIGGNDGVELIFNYFGMYQQLERDGSLFMPLNEQSVQPTEEGGADTVRMSLLEIDVTIYEGRLQMTLVYDKRMKHEEQLRKFMELTKLTFDQAARILPGMEQKLTAVDAPLMHFNYAKLNALLRELQPITQLLPSQIQTVHPCTPVQENLLNSQAKGVGYYDTRLIWKTVTTNTSKNIDIERLAKTWFEVCERHAMLRSIILPNPSEDSKWLQVVVTKNALRDVMPDVEVFRDQRDIQEVLAIVHNDPAPDYNMNGGLRHRLKLWYVLEDDRVAWVCQIDISHALIDGAATEAIIKDWKACYDGTAPRQVPKFTDYVRFLQQSVDANGKPHPRQQELDFWKSYAERMPQVMYEFQNKQANGNQIMNPGTRLCSKDVTSVSSSSLSRCCENRQVTAACIFRAAWAKTLRSYTSSNDIVFGYLAHGRDVPVQSAATIVGPMVVTLPFWARVTKDLSLSTLLKETHQDMMKSLGMQSVAWAEISPNERPFDTLVNYRGAVEAGFDANDDFVFREIETYDPMEYTVVLEVEQNAENARVRLNYWPHEMSGQSICDIAKCLEGVLQEILEL